VVKANAYGHGAPGCAKAALEAGAYGLAVANLKEGLPLRALFPETPILVLGPSMPEELEEMAAQDICPAVFYPEQVEALAKAAETLGRSVGCHLALDTGMNRIGARMGESLNAMLETFKKHPAVEMRGVFSHLYAADGGEAETKAQAENFARCFIAPPPLCSRIGSAAVIVARGSRQSRRREECFRNRCKNPHPVV